MRSAAIFGLSVLLVSVTTFAQRESQTYSPPGQIVMVMPPPTVGTCPLGMHVRQGIGGQLLDMKGDRRAEISGAHLYLTLTGPASGRIDALRKTQSVPENLKITSATVTVHGLSGKGRIIAAKSSQDRSAEATKTITVRFAAPDRAEVSGELLAPGFTATTLVELNSVTYANGETWTFSGSVSCNVAPDPTMLIADR